MNERPFPRRVTGFWALALCLALTAAPVRGAESPRAADLYLWLDARGDAQAALSLDFEPPDSPELERGLHRLLGARAEDVGLNEEGGGWVLRARGRGMLRRRGLVVAGVLDAGPLREPLRRLGVRAFTVSVSHPEAGFTRCAEATRVPQIKPGDVTYLTAFPTALAVTLLRLEYGYRAGDLLRICGPLALFLLLPIGATLALRRRALRAAGEEPAAVWFRFARTFRWVILGTLFGWLALFAALPAGECVGFALGFTGKSSAVLGYLFGILPPVVLILVCGVLAQPVAQRVRGVEWTQRDVARHSGGVLAAAFVPVLLAVVGIETLTENPRTGVLWSAAALVSRMALSRLVVGQARSFPQSLTAGELRDRLFALAEQAGVRLQQVYVMPARKGRLANAFAASGGRVLLTDYLLQHLSKRELDAVMAHELMHLRRRDPRRLLLAAILAMGLPVILLVAIAAALGLEFDRYALGIPLLMPLGIPVFYRVSRRFERAADAGAVALTLDPEALITALAKLTHLNTMPMDWGKWDERLITHPSTQRRALAIAAGSGIPAERLQEILRDLDADTERYALPASFAAEERVFSTAFKSQASARNSWVLNAVLTLTPAAVAAFARLGGLEDGTRWAVSVVGFAATISLHQIAVNFIALWGYPALRQRLRSRLEQEGLPAEAWRGAFVGFAPAAAPRIYEGFYDWDMGFLFLDGDRLCYAGEETRFALRRGQVTAIRLGAGPPAWRRTRRVYVTWRDEERTTGGTFYLRPADASSLRQMELAMPHLAKELQQWREQPASPHELPPALTCQAPPALGAVTSASPRAAATLSGLIRYLMVIALLAMGAALLFNLSLDPFAGGEGWHVVAVSILGTVFQWIPYWRHREHEHQQPSGS